METEDDHHDSLMATPVEEAGEDGKDWEDWEEEEGDEEGVDKKYEGDEYEDLDKKGPHTLWDTV